MRPPPMGGSIGWVSTTRTRGRSSLLMPRSPDGTGWPIPGVPPEGASLLLPAERSAFPVRRTAREWRGPRRGGVADALDGGGVLAATAAAVRRAGEGPGHGPRPWTGGVPGGLVASRAPPL